MRRNIIVEKLIAEGLSEKTLVKLNDKQLNELADRMLGETITTTMASIQKSPALQAAAKDKTQTLNVVGEEDVTEDLKGNQKKIDKNHNGKIDSQDFKILRGKKKEVKEEKPSAGLSKEKKSAVVKKAKAGEDIGKKGKGFEKIADKAAKKYGSKEKGKKVAAAAMWKSVQREGVDTKVWVETITENELYHSFTSKNEIIELIKNKLNESKKVVQENYMDVNDIRNVVTKHLQKNKQ
jgi:hypothetical protein